MKTKRALFELFMLLTIAVLLVWKFWPVKNSSSAIVAATTAPTLAKTVVSPAMASLVAVEAPKAPPVNVAPMSNNVVVPGNGSSLYDSTKERATLTGTVQNGDEDYNAVINGSPGLAKLQDILAQKEVLTQSLSPIDSTSLPPPQIVVTDLGEIDLTLDQPVLEKLASGDQAVITLASHPNAPGKYGQVLTLQTKFLYQSGNEWIEYPGSESGLSILNGPSVKSGQEEMVKSIASGNEIHFVPVFANPAGTSP
jgi:hypothetical protein